MSRLSVGRRLRKLRQDHGLQLSTAAHMAGMHPSVLCRTERGQIAFGSGCAWKLARVYGAAVLALIEPRALLHRLDVTAGDRCRELDGQGKVGFRVPGGIEVRLPREMAEAL